MWERRDGVMISVECEERVRAVQHACGKGVCGAGQRDHREIPCETQAKEESEDEEDVDIMQQIEELQKQRDMLSRMSMGKKNTSEMKHRISMLLEQSKAITSKK